MPNPVEQVPAPRPTEGDTNQQQDDATRRLQQDARDGNPQPPPDRQDTRRGEQTTALPGLEITGTEDSRRRTGERHQFVSPNAVSADRAREIRAQFPALSEEQMTAARRGSDADLAGMRIRSLDGTTETNVSRLLDDPKIGLTAEHKEIIRQTAAEVRAHFKGIGGPYQDANWEHTAEEVGHSLKIAQKLGMNSAETTKLVLTSLLSDSVKTPQNFFTHHVDGAVGWTEVADRVLKNLPEKERETIKRDVERAILTHQISPPSFMSGFHARIIREGLKGDLDKATVGKDLSEGERQTLKGIKDKIDKPADFTAEEVQLLEKVCEGKPELLKLVKESAAIEGLRQKLANPLDPKNRVERDGMSVLDLDAKEAGYLKRLGLDRVWVPDPKSPSYQLEIAAIAADGGQYASVPGKFKYTLLAGPDTQFKTPTLDASWASPEDSARSVKEMLREFPQLTELSTEELAATQKVLKEKVKPALADWIAQQSDVPRNSDGSVPFFDSPLKYPRELTVTEQAELKDLQKREAPSSTDRARIYELQHAGLSPLEAKQYDFAREIVKQAASVIKGEFQYVEKAPAQTVAPDTAIDRTRGRTGGRRGTGAAETEVASGAADIKENRGGGFDVAAGDKVPGGRASAKELGEKLGETEIAELRKEIMDDKHTSAEQKARALHALELASNPANKEAREVVARAQKEGKRTGGIEGAEGHAVGIGLVVLTLAGWYAQQRASSTRETYVPNARVN